MIELPKDHPYINGRVCTTCKTMKPTTGYTLCNDKRSFGGVQMRSKCKTCEETRKHKRFVTKTYGIAFDEYKELLERQDSKCAICNSSTGNKRAVRLSVDHCHDSKKVRGLLCSSCNHGLGQFKDSPELLNKAISYLLRARTNDSC